MLTDQVNDLAIPRTSRVSRGYLAIKRVMDVTLAGLGLVLASPVLLLIALAIRLDSKGPALFKQTRIGRFGQPFTCYKFRTMYVDADPNVHRAYIEAYANGQIDDEKQALGTEAAPFKMANDNRVTPLGRWLRRTSLDELPQLINVLKGEMSLVGPRPDVPYSVALYKDWHKQRLAVHPGLTGLWQIKGRGRVSYEEGMRLDVEYVQRQSLLLDMEILIKTVPAVLSMRGAA